MSALGFHCSSAFLWLGRVSLAAVARLLPAVASLVVDQRLEGARALVVRLPGSRAQAQ